MRFVPWHTTLLRILVGHPSLLSSLEADFNTEGKVDPRSTKIHGFMSPLPRGFIVIQVPRSAGFLDDPPVSRGLRRKIKEVFNPAQPKSTVISSNYSQVKVVIAIGQALYGITTLYNARGDQIERYGYAAFGLTVVPYAYMSVVNLIANLLCPEYSAMYMIESRAMRDAAELITENLSSTDTVKPTRTATSRVQQLSSNAQKVPTTVTTRQNVDGDIALMPVTSRNSTEAHSQKRNNWQSAEDALRLSAHLDSEDQSGNLASSQAVPDDTERDEQSVALVPQIPAPTPGEVSRRKPFSGIVGTLDEKWDRAVSGDKDKIRADIHHDEEDGGQLLRTPVLKNMAQAFFGPLFWFISCTWIFDLVVWSPFICLPIAVVGGLSSFKPGTMSTPAQRTWTMTWLAFSMLIGIATKVRSSYALVLINPIAWFMSPSNLIGAPKMLYFSAASVLYGAPAIGGFVVVAQMLSAYGVCSKTS